MKALSILALALLLGAATTKNANAIGMIANPIATNNTAASTDAEDEIPEFDPYAEDAEQQLMEFDAVYEQTFGESPFLNENLLWNASTGGCYRESCQVYAYVNKATQRITIYQNGVSQGTYPVSTGKAGHGTPDFDTHPDGRIYSKYSSKKYPGGDYNGLGNMPYVVFIRGGFGIHGTPAGNWKRLGTPASHGCIRVHPTVGKMFNQMVRAAGAQNTWITVQ